MVDVLNSPMALNSIESEDAIMILKGKLFLLQLRLPLGEMKRLG